MSCVCTGVCVCVWSQKGQVGKWWWVAKERRGGSGEWATLLPASLRQPTRGERANPGADKWGNRMAATPSPPSPPSPPLLVGDRRLPGDGGVSRDTRKGKGKRDTTSGKGEGGWGLSRGCESVGVRWVGEKRRSRGGCQRGREMRKRQDAVTAEGGLRRQRKRNGRRSVAWECV